MILRAEQLIETMAETIGEAQTKTHCDPFHDLKIQAKIDTLCGVEGSKLVKTWADTVVKVETRTLGNTLGQLQAEALINTPGNAVA